MDNKIDDEIKAQETKLEVMMKLYETATRIGMLEEKMDETAKKLDEILAKVLRAYSDAKDGDGL